MQLLAGATTWVFLGTWIMDHPAQMVLLTKANSPEPLRNA
jgi:hypothetical protein